jgi:hypothetical protein
VNKLRGGAASSGPFPRGTSSALRVLAPGAGSPQLVTVSGRGVMPPVRGGRVRDG